MRTARLITSVRRHVRGVSMISWLLAAALALATPPAAPPASSETATAIAVADPVPQDQVMALPYHLYVLTTSGTDIKASRDMAYGTALILVLIVLIVNLLSNALRRYFSKKVKMH